MSKPDRELCKLNKAQIASIVPELAASIHQMRFICRKCARVAPTKKLLCKPCSIVKLAPNATALSDAASSAG